MNINKCSICRKYIIHTSLGRITGCSHNFLKIRKSLKIGVVGSRKRTDKQSVVDFINSLPPGDIVVSGGCQGVDTWAAETAIFRGMERPIVFKPDLTGCVYKWQYTERYYARNRRIAEECDILIAFVSPDRKGGTENTIKAAQKLGKEIIIL